MSVVIQLNRRRISLLETLWRRDREGDWAQCHYCGWRLRFPGDTHLDPRWYAPAQIDHIVPRARGGSDDVGNLVLCCPACNTEKGTNPYAHFVYQFAKRTRLYLASELAALDVLKEERP